jgi:ferrous iron transport protein A
MVALTRIHVVVRLEIFVNDPNTKTGESPTLSGLRLGQWARVRAIDGGRFMAQRMGMLGIRRGVDVRVVHGPGPRGAVVQVGGARIALGRGVIEQIHVELHAALDTGANVKGEHR